jgi:hypothetical protein
MRRGSKRSISPVLLGEVRRLRGAGDGETVRVISDAE